MARRKHYALAILAALSISLASQAAVCGIAQDVKPAPPSVEAPDERREQIEADISTRSVAVTSSFTGTEIIVFGSVLNSRQESRDSGLYDVVAVLEGAKTPIIARRKTRLGGVWANTEWMRFEDLPSYYAILSTRPLATIASQKTLAHLAIGFDQILMTPRVASFSPEEAALDAYRLAVVRLKQNEKLYLRNDYGVSFIGRGLFRTTIALPANVPVGSMRARLYLFRDGQLLSQYSAQVRLSREGVERLLYTFAHDYPALYGLFTVAVALAAGLLASAFFRRPAM